MKLQAENPNNILNSNFETEDTQEFGIKDPSFIIELLSSGFYSYPIRTLVQEYIANGRDATREIGADTPLTIRVPTRMESTFVLRDFGIGMSPERMNGTFLNYGSSTKRDTNGQIGGFGIGGKSALAYTDEFDIIAYFDGMKRHYNVYRSCDEETGKDKVKLDLISEEPTDEPNGTEIVVAVDPNDIQKFQDAIYRATYFADVKPNYVGIEEHNVPEQLEFTKITDRLRIASRNDTPDCLGLRNLNNILVLLIDGVVYPVSREMTKDYVGFQEAFNCLKDNQIMFYEIGNGVVKLSGSREDIKESKITRRALEKISEEIRNELNSYITRFFPYTQSLEEHVETVHTMVQQFKMPSNHPKRNFEIYKIHTIDSYYNPKQTIMFDGIECFKVQYTRYDGDKRIRSESNLSSFTLSDFETMYFDDIGDDEPERKKNRRIKYAICENNRRQIKVVRPFGMRCYNDIEYLAGDNNMSMIVFDEDGNVKPDMRTRREEYIEEIPAEFFEKLKQDFKMKPLSSLQEPPKVTKAKSVAAKRSKEKIALTAIGEYGRQNKKTITLDGNSDKYVYALMHYTNFVDGNNKMRALGGYVRKNTNYTLVGINKEAKKLIEKSKDENFISVKDFLKQHEPKDIESIYLKLFNNISNDNFKSILSKATMLTSFKNNDMVKEMETLYKKSVKAGGIDVPTAILEAWDLTEKHPKVQALKNKEICMIKCLKRKIPVTLLHNISRYDLRKSSKEIDKLIQGRF